MARRARQLAGLGERATPVARLGERATTARRPSGGPGPPRPLNRGRPGSTDRVLAGTALAKPATKRSG